MDKLIIGCGYLGTRVARRWLEAGHNVWATTRTVERITALQAMGLKALQCDVLQPDSLAVLPEAETILYCVGFDRSSSRSMRQVYVEGLSNFLAHLRKHPRICKKLIYISSTSVYGQTNGEWVDETAATEPITESGRIVLEAEKLLREGTLTPALSQREREGATPALSEREREGATSRDRQGAVVLRFAGIYGPGRLIRDEAIKSGTPLAGDPEKWLNLIHVEDGASAILAAEQLSKPGGVYSVADDEPVRRGEFYRFLAELIQSPAPRFVLERAAGFNPAARESARTHSSGEGPNRRISNRRMKELLRVELQYPTFREGLKASLRKSEPSLRKSGPEA